MKKSDLKTGMVVEMRSGSKFLCLTQAVPTKFYGYQPLFINGDNFICLDSYDEDLKKKDKSDKTYDIIKIYQPNVAGLDFTIKEATPETLIWNVEKEEKEKRIKIEQVKKLIEHSEFQLLQLRNVLSELLE